VSDDSEKEKAALLDLLARVPDRCEKLEVDARDILRLSREARDTAHYQETVVKVLPADDPTASDYIRRSARAWSEFEQAAEAVLKVKTVGVLTAVVSGNTTTASLGASFVVQHINLSPEALSMIERAGIDYRERTRVDEVVEQAKSEMERLSLDAEAPGLRSALSLLEEAYSAIKYPLVAVSGPTALLTLRSSINRSIEEILRRRPVQEKAGARRDQILSIGRHCGRLGLGPEHFENLATDDHMVNDELSGRGKKAAMQQTDVVRLFVQGAQCLRALLTSVDEVRLKKA
jgi:hypothetical protein